MNRRGGGWPRTGAWARGAGRAALAALALGLIPAAAPAEPGAPAARGEPGARLGSSGSATEYWDLLARLDSGHRVFARFSITNEGPGSRTAYAIGHVVDPDGRTHRFTNGRQEGHWSLRDDGHQLEIGSSRLFLRGPERRLVIHRPKLGVILDLHFTPPRRGRPFDPGLPGYSVDLLHAAAPVQGTLQLVDEMPAPMAVRGVIACTHTWMDRSETELSLRRIDFFSLPPGPAGTAISLMTVAPPTGPPVQRVLVESGDRVLLDRSKLALAVEGLAGLNTRPGYSVPARVALEERALQGQIQLARLLVEDDPMGVIPQPFRWLMSLKSQPHRLWIESPFEVRVAGAPQDPVETLRGVGVTAINFLNPL